MTPGTPRAWSVAFVEPKLLSPAYGHADRKRMVALVRADLPGCLKPNVLCHELFHLRDDAEGWLWRELRANVYAALHFPLGFVVGTLMTLGSAERRRFYAALIKSHVRRQGNG